MEENKDTLLGKFIKTLSYKEQAYDLIKMQYYLINLELEQFIHKNLYAMNLE